MSAFRPQRAAVLGAVAGALVVSLAACSSASDGGSSSGPAASGSSATAEKGTVGIVEFDTTAAIDNQFVQGTKSELEAKGWKTLSQDPKGDPGQANGICSQFVTRKVQALVVTTFALDQMAQCMSQAKAAKIPVFYIGSPLLDGMAGSVDVTSPKPINDLFVPYVKDNAVTDILTLDYTPGTPCRLRKEYRDEQLKGVNVKVTRHEFPIPGQVVDAQNATAAWLAAHPAGSGKFAIWACFTDPTAGAVAAIKQAGRTDEIPIYTWDFNKTILDPLKSGQVAATLSLDGTAVGGQVATLVDGYKAGGTPTGVPAANKILTKENIDAYVAENPNSIK
jgi:ribose transport system substrate-binding protein